MDIDTDSETEIDTEIDTDYDTDYDTDDDNNDNELKSIVESIKDNKYVDKTVWGTGITDRIDKYIKKHDIHDTHEGRTMLSWTAESEKLNVFLYLLGKGAMENPPSDQTWPGLLIITESYLKKVKDTYTKDAEDEKKKYISSWNKMEKLIIEIITPVLKNQQEELKKQQIEIQKKMEMKQEKLTRAEKDNLNKQLEEDHALELQELKKYQQENFLSIDKIKSEFNDPTVDTTGTPLMNLLDETELTPEQEIEQEGIVNEIEQLDQGLIAWEPRRLFVKKIKEMKEFIKSKNKSYETKKLITTLPHVKTEVPPDVIGKIATYLDPNLKKRAKTMKMYAEILGKSKESTGKRKESTVDFSEPNKKRRRFGGVKTRKNKRNTLKKKRKTKRRKSLKKKQRKTKRKTHR